MDLDQSNYFHALSSRVTEITVPGRYETLKDDTEIRGPVLSVLIIVPVNAKWRLSLVQSMESTRLNDSITNCRPGDEQKTGEDRAISKGIMLTIE